MELSRQIAALTEDMEERRSEKNMLLNLFDKSDDAGMKEIRQRVNSMEASLHRLEQAEGRYNSELNAALAEYQKLAEQAAGLDADELIAERQNIRPAMTRDAVNRLKAAYGKQYDYSHMQRAESDVAAMLGEEAEKPSIRRQLREISKRKEPRQRKPKEYEQVR